MFLLKAICVIIIWMFIGVIINLTVSYIVVGRLGNKCHPYPGLFSELYHKHFERLKTTGGYGIYKRKSLFRKFIDTQLFWPFSVASTIRKGIEAKNEFNEIVKTRPRIQNNP